MANYKEYKCDLCSTNDAVEVPYIRLYTNNELVHICKNCGFIYVIKRRTAEEIAKSWSQDIFGNFYSAKIPAVKARHTYVADFLDTKIGLKNKKLIDIGGGEGQFLEIVKEQYNASVFAIEPSHKNCELMRNDGIKCFNGTIEGYLNSNEKKLADIVTIMWTLENCVSCRDMLGAAWELLNVNGFLLIATGSRILVPFKKAMHDYFSSNPADTHCFRFSYNTLVGILAESSFEKKYVNR